MPPKTPLLIPLQLRQIYVSGKVQRVFFRKHTLAKARGLGISGWVRNETDGRVAIMAEGTPENLDALVTWCHTGPSKAEVTDVVSRIIVDHVTEGGQDGKRQSSASKRRFSSFDIVR